MTEPVLDAGTFRAVCSQFPTGVTAITAITADGSLAALTVNSFTSVSLDPPKVLFCVGVSASSYPVIMRAERIAVHILLNDQQDVARLFATSGLSGADKLSSLDWRPGPGGVPILSGSAAVLVGRTDEILTSGDHVIVLLDIDHLEHKATTQSALSFYRGRFTAPLESVLET